MGEAFGLHPSEKMQRFCRGSDELEGLEDSGLGEGGGEFGQRRLEFVRPWFSVDETSHGLGSFGFGSRFESFIGSDFDGLLRGN